MLQSHVSSRFIISSRWKLNADIWKFRLRTIKMFQNKSLKSALYISLVTKMKLMMWNRWRNLHFSKCPKIYHIRFGFFCRSIIDHVLFLETPHHQYVRKPWNTPFFLFSEADRKIGHFEEKTQDQFKNEKRSS